MKALESFKRRYQSSLAPIWHRFAPSVTIRKRFSGTRVFMDLRDNIDDLTKSRYDLELREWPLHALPEIVGGDVWDVGANVGLFSVRAAQCGHRCTAFELSPKAVSLMRRTRDAGGLDFEVVDRPLTCATRLYEPPRSAHTENSLVPSENAEHTSITFEEAEGAYGTPRLLKMDIEGGEKEFFESDAFKAWILDRSIVWMVEVHSEQLGHTPEWTEVPHVELAPRQVLYCRDESEIERVASECERLDPRAPAKA